MASAAFRYPYDVLSAMEPWRDKLGDEFDNVVSRLADRDHALEDYVSGTGRPSPTATSLGDRVEFLLNKPTVRAYRNTNQTLTTGVEASLVFTGTRYDTNTFNANTAIITFNTAGVYACSFDGTFPTNGVGYRYFYMRVNGTTPISFSSNASGGIVSGVAFCLATEYKFAAGDYIEIRAFQDSGGNLDILSGGNYTPEFSATWLTIG